MIHTKTCFVGEPPQRLDRETPGNWLLSRVACHEHKQQATLKSGEKLQDFLARRQDTAHPLEGSGLNYLINPVGILSHRAWCDFHFEGPAIYEEVFLSETYFDFYVQHMEFIQPFFYAFHRAHQKTKNTGGYFETILSLRKETPDAEKHLNDLINMWTLQLSLQNELKIQKLAWVESPDHAQQTFLYVYERMNEETVLANVVNDMLFRLVELGEKRFMYFPKVQTVK